MTESSRQFRRYMLTPDLLPQEHRSVLFTAADTLTPEGRACHEALLKLRKDIQEAGSVSDRKPRIGQDCIVFFVRPELREDDRLAELDRQIHNILLEAARDGVLFPEFKDKGMEVSPGVMVEDPDEETAPEGSGNAQHTPYDVELESSADELTDDDRRVLLRFCHFVLSTEPDIFIYRGASSITDARALRAAYESVSEIAERFQASDDRDSLFTAAALEIKLLVEILDNWKGFPKDFLPSAALLVKLIELLFEQCDVFDSIKRTEADPDDEAEGSDDDRQVPRQRGASED